MTAGIGVVTAFAAVGATLGIASSVMTGTLLAFDVLGINSPNHDYIEMEAEFGHVPASQVAQGGAAIVRAEAEEKRAKAALGLFEFNVTQARKKVALIKSVIPKEQNSISMRKNRLDLAAPTSGIIRLYCYKNAFLKKGDIVAEIL